MTTPLSSLLDIARASGTTFGSVLDAWLAERFIVRLGTTKVARESLLLRGAPALNASFVEPGLRGMAPISLQLRPRLETKLRELVEEIAAVELGDGVAFGGYEPCPALEMPRGPAWRRRVRIKATYGRTTGWLDLDVLIRRFGRRETFDELYPVLVSGMDSSRSIFLRPSWNFAETLAELCGDWIEGRKLERYVVLHRLAFMEAKECALLHQAVRVAMFRRRISHPATFFAPLEAVRSGVDPRRMAWEAFRRSHALDWTSEPIGAKDMASGRQVSGSVVLPDSFDELIAELSAFVERWVDREWLTSRGRPRPFGTG